MKDRLFGPAAVLLFSAFLVFDIWLLFVKPSGSWEDHAGLWSTVVGLFALATGFVSSTELRKALPRNLDNMTSPWPQKFLSGNWTLVGLSVNFPIALLYGGSPWTRRGLSTIWPVEVFAALLKIISALLMTSLWAVATAAYLILVMPAAYPAYAAVGFSLLTIRESSVPRDKVVVVDARNVVEQHDVPLRAFAVGALGTISGFLFKVIALY